MSTVVKFTALIGALLFTALALALEPITGAFGVKFGEPISRYQTTFNMLGTVWGIVPPQPNSYFPSIAPDTYISTTTPDGIITGITATKRERPKECRSYREALIGHLAGRYGEARRFAHDPGYGDRYVILQGQKIISIICNDNSGTLAIEYYAKPNFSLHGLEALDYDLEEFFSGAKGVDATGF